MAKSVRRLPSVSVKISCIDCEQSLFFSKISGKERKTSTRANVTVSVTWEWRCREPLVAWALVDERKGRLHWFHIRSVDYAECGVRSVENDECGKDDAMLLFFF